MHQLLTVLLLGTASLAMAQAGGQLAVEDKDAADARQLFDEAQDRLRSGKAGMAKVSFETLIAVYPESGLVERAKEGIRSAEQREPKPPIVTSIQFEKFRKVKVREIVQRLKDREAELRVEEPCDTRCIEEARDIVSELLAEKGLANPRLRVDTRTVPPRSMGVAFTLVRD